MNSVFKIKIVVFKTEINNSASLQDGIRPDCILYTGPVACNFSTFGVSLKKWNKAVSKCIGEFTAEIEDNIHCLIYIKVNSDFFKTTHAVGSSNEHTVPHEDILKKSLNNFKQFKGIS